MHSPVPPAQWRRIEELFHAALERPEEERAAFVLRNGQPVVSEILAHKAGGSWIVLGRNLTPEFQVTSGRRRLFPQRSSTVQPNILAVVSRMSCGVMTLGLRAGSRSDRISLAMSSLKGTRWRLE